MYASQCLNVISPPRSATLSGGPEMYGRSGIEYLFAAAAPRQDDDDDDDEVGRGLYINDDPV